MSKKNRAGGGGLRLPTASEAAAGIQRLCPLRPALGMVLGSGFEKVAEAMRVSKKISYVAIPGFPRPTVPGHPGRLLLGHLEGTPVMMLCGRCHYYEGYSMEEATFPIRVLAACGIRDLLLTNAAGGINPRLRAGDFMLLEDHINFMPANPLRGKMDGTAAFLDLTEVYDAGLGNLLKEAAWEIKLGLRSGVYLAVSGPCYETPAEIRAFGRMGADAVGMSTVPEAIVARHCGMRVAGVSCITNLAAGRGKGPLSHADVLSTAAGVQAKAVRLLSVFARIYRKKGCS